MKEKCEENNFDLITHFNINTHRRTSARGLHLNNYSDRQLTKNFLNFIEKGISIRICNGSYCTLIIEKTNFEDIRNRISNDTILTQNSSDDINNCFTELQHFRMTNPKNLILVHLNINSLRKKIETMKIIIEDTFDIFLISETKIDNSFPNSQFSINGYMMFRRDRNCFGGDFRLHVKDSIASKQLNSHKENIDAEVIYLEINIQRIKWLIIGTYKPPSQNNSLFLENLANNLSTYLKDYDNILLLGDFNMTPENTNLQHFTDSFDLENLIHEATCFKGLPGCIDLINSGQFQISSTGSSR